MVSLTSTASSTPFTPVYPVLLDPCGSFMEKQVEERSEITNVNILDIFNEKVNIGKGVSVSKDLKPFIPIPHKDRILAQEVILRILIQLAKKVREKAIPDHTTSAVTELDIMNVTLYVRNHLNEDTFLPPAEPLKKTVWPIGTSLILKRFPLRERLANLANIINPDLARELGELLNAGNQIISPLIRGESISSELADYQYTKELIEKINGKIKELLDFSEEFELRSKPRDDVNEIILRAEFLNSCIMNCVRTKAVVGKLLMATNLPPFNCVLILNYVDRQDWSRYTGTEV